MNGNELINTNLIDYSPLRNAARGFDGAANRAERRISATQKRVQDLQRLDPTNPLALLITLMGAKREGEIRDELNILRGQAGDQQRKKDIAKQEKEWRKNQLSDLKIKGLDKAFGVFANKEHGGDIDAALKDPNMQSKVFDISNEFQPMSDKELGQLLDTYNKEKASLLTLKSTGGDKLEPHEIRQHELFVRGLRQTLNEQFRHRYGKDFDAADPPPPTTGKDGGDQSAPPEVGTKTDPPVVLPEGPKAKEALLGKNKKGGPKKEDKPPTGIEKIITDASDLIDPNKGAPPGWELGKHSTGGDREEVFYNEGNGSYVKETDKGYAIGFVGKPPIQSGLKRNEAFKIASDLKEKKKKTEVKEQPSSVKPVDVAKTGAKGSYDYIADKLEEAHQSGIPPEVIDAANERAYAKAFGIDSAMGETPRPTGPPTTQDLIGLPNIDASPESSPSPPPVPEDPGMFSNLLGELDELREKYFPSEKEVDPRESIRESKQQADRLQAIRRGEINEQGNTPEEQANIDRANRQALIASGELSPNTGAAIVEHKLPKALDPVPEVDPSMIPKADRDLGAERSKAEAMQKKAAMKRLRSDPLISSLIQVESSGRPNAIGYKMHKDPRTGKFVYDTVKVKDKWGRTVERKVPLSYGLMQITVPTARASNLPAAVKAFKGKSDKQVVKTLLSDPELNVRIGKEFVDKLRTQISQNKYVKDNKFSKKEIDVLVGAAYNWKGEGLNELINKAEPNSFSQVLARIKFPGETREQIRKLRKALK